MNSTVGKVVLAVIGFFAALWVLNIVVGVAMKVLFTVLPLALVAGAVYVGYRMYRGKALGGGRRTLP